MQFIEEYTLGGSKNYNLKAMISFHLSIVFS